MKKNKTTTMQISIETWKKIHSNKEVGDSMEDALLKLIKKVDEKEVG